MSENYEQELFELIYIDDAELTKEDIAEYLNKEGFDINKKIFRESDKPWQDDPKYLICEAVTNCRFEVVEALVENGAKLDIFEEKIDFNPINIAARENKIEIVKLFIDNKADLLIKDYHGDAALRSAVKNINYEMVELILENIGDSKEAELEKSYALFFAVRSNNYEIAKLLLENNADPNMRIGILKITALNLASSKTDISGLNIPLINLLLDYGAEFRVENYQDEDYDDAKQFVLGMISDRKAEEESQERQKIINKEISVNSAQISAIKRVVAKKPKIRGLKI